MKHEYGCQTSDKEVSAESQQDEAKSKAQGIVGTVKNAADDTRHKLNARYPPACFVSRTAGTATRTGTEFSNPVIVACPLNR